MAKSEYVKIHRPENKNNTLKFDLTYSQNIRKYFRTDHFTVGYDEDIRDVDPGILHVPVVANIAPMAWVSGADIYVDQLDKTFIQSLNDIKLIFMKWFSNISFSTEINVGEVSSNRFENDGYGLLFSGGLDSTTTYIKHREKKPNLIMVWGADVPLNEPQFWMQIRNKYVKFSDQSDMKINFIKSNFREFLNEKLVNKHYSKQLRDRSFWGIIQHGLGFTGLCAPLTVVNHMGNLFIASTVWKSNPKTWGSHPSIDNRISWADVKVIHDGYEISRQEKIKYIMKPYVEETSSYPQLRVCYDQRHTFNCKKCDKCARTIIGLIVEDIDPSKCGFDLDRTFFDYVRKKLVSGEFLFYNGIVILWKDIQACARENVITYNLFNFQTFLKWFRNLKISHKKPGLILSSKKKLLSIPSRLPRQILNEINRVRWRFDKRTNKIT